MNLQAIDSGRFLDSGTFKLAKLLIIILTGHLAAIRLLHRSQCDQRNTIFLAAVFNINLMRPAIVKKLYKTHQGFLNGNKI